MIHHAHPPATRADSRSMKRMSYSDGEQTERSPLLELTGEHGNTLKAPSHLKSWQTAENVTFLVMLVVLLVSLGDQLMENPQIRIIEAVVCYRYYEAVDPSKLLMGRDEVGPGAIGGVSEMLCKADDVQSELALLRGWQQFFDGLPSLLLALPFGWAADRFGRKPVIFAGMLAFVLRAVWVELV